MIQIIEKQKKIVSNTLRTLLKTPNTKKVSNFFIERDQSSSSILSYSLPPRSSSYISYISNFLAFSLSPLQPTSLSSRNYSRQEETSLKKSCYNNSYVSLSLDSRSRLSFLTTFLISLFLPFSMLYRRVERALLFLSMLGTRGSCYPLLPLSSLGAFLYMRVQI